MKEIETVGITTASTPRLSKMMQWNTYGKHCIHNAVTSSHFVAYFNCRGAKRRPWHVATSRHNHEGKR